VGFIRRYRWPIIGVGAVVLVVGFLLFRPDKLFVDDVVEESLADAFAVTASEEDQPASAPESTTTTTTAPTTEAPPETEGTAPTDSTTTTTTTTTTEAPPPAGPVALTTGGFYGIDHSASGTATVYEQDGRFVLRFEDDTDIQNGPDLYVWVLPSDGYEGGSPGEFIDLGKIKGNVGGQNYELPADFDPARYRSVLIWCLRFNVPFAAAPLA
jgi:hypothetical protein